MARPKNPENVKSENIQDVSVYPDGYEMNSWDNNETRGLDIATSRSRVPDRRPSPMGANNYKPKLWFPIEEMPSDMQYGLMTESLLGEPQADNIQELYEDGWDFINQTEHPTYLFREYRKRSDGRLRRRNCILMKMPKNDYLSKKQEEMNESAQKQREVSYMTDTFGSAPNDPRFVVENSGSYTPSYSNRRG